MGRERVPAVDGHLMSHRWQRLPYFLVIRLDAAVFRDHAPAANKGNTQSRFPRLCSVEAGKCYSRSLGLHSEKPVIERHQLLIVLFRRVLAPNHFPTGASHFLDQLKVRGQRLNRVRKLTDTTNAVQQSSFAVMNQLTP